MSQEPPKPTSPPPDYQAQQDRSGPSPGNWNGPPPQGHPQGYSHHGYPPQGPPPQQGTFPPGPPPHQGSGYPMQPMGQGPTQGTPIPALGAHPAPVSCPNCHHSGVTAVEYSSGGFTHSLAALFCFVTCLGCIPYFFSGLKDATHKCTKCGVPLATYHRSGRTEPHIQG